MSNNTLTKRPPFGWLGWVVLAFYVVGWDYIALRTGKIPTLSQAYAHGRSYLPSRLAVDLATLVVIAHLQKVPLFSKYDPLSRAAHALSRRENPPSCYN